MRPDVQNFQDHDINNEDQLRKIRKDDFGRLDRHALTATIIFYQDPDCKD
jgi:hypothetical protein